MDYHKSKYFKKIEAIKEQKKVSDAIINNNLLIIEDFLEKHTKCTAGPMSKCKQPIPGWEDRLAIENNNVYIRSNHCAHWLHDNPNYLLEKNILYANYEIKSFTTNFDDYINEHMQLVDSEKKRIYGNILINLRKILDGKPNTKGLYIYGTFGVGKTHLLKCVANSFALKNKTVVFITPNEIIKRAKDAISKTDGSEYYQLEKKCFNVDVLILDDIGAESVSEWSRDEVLFGILNYRMDHKKLTFFSANKPIADLEKTYINKKQFGASRLDEILKSSRFAERIKALATETRLSGNNKRY